MQDPIRVIQYGLGPIGLASARTVLQKEATGKLKLVGAIDVDPAKAGRDVAELLERDRATGVVVSAEADAVLRAARADVVLHTTTSFLGTMFEQLEGCARAGVDVVSSTEELAYPYDRHPDIAARLHDVARKHNVSLIGTGVNPGYAMDALALMATGPCNEVSRIHVQRVVDASHRRLPLQRKVGAGITEAAFAERKATGLFGHIGLRESLLMVADGLDWKLEHIEETLDPMMAVRPVTTPYLTVAEGQVAGIHHVVRGTVRGKEVLTLDLKMYVGAEDPRDEIQVEGDPPIHLIVQKGIFGDTATIAALINTAGIIQAAPAGLLTMKDLPVPRAFATALSG